MRLASSVLLSLSLLVVSVAAAEGPARERSKVERFAERYLDGLFRAKPHLATFMGEHRFDGQLPDFAPAALKRREAELVKQQTELAALSGGGELSRDERADVEIMAGGIALELLYLREIKDWEWDPRLYDSFPFYDPRELVGGRLSDIIHGDFAPEAQRKKSVLAQLKALPKFLTTVQAGLLHPTGKRHTPRPYLEQSLKAARGTIELFEGEVKAFVGDGPPVREAVAALRRYETFLGKELAPHADGDWRLGVELYGKKFPLALQTSATPAATLARARKAFFDARGRLYAIARKLHGELWPTQPLPPEAAAPPAQQVVIQKVVDELGKSHPKPFDLVATHGRYLEALREFITKHDLLTLPPPETLRVAPMPEFKRGSSAAEYLAPGVLLRSDKWQGTYYVDPIDPSWPADKVESYLRGQNHYVVQTVATHEAYPGHHVQYSYAKKNLDPVRAVLWNGPMVEGWAVYCEGLLVRLGWGDKENDRFRLINLLGQMIASSNAIIDIGLETGQMKDEEAVRFMIEEGFQPRAQAEKKLLRAQLDSTQLVQYFLGLDEITELEADYRKKVGESFSQRTFDEALIGHGSIPLKLLRDYLLAP